MVYMLSRHGVGDGPSKQRKSQMSAWNDFYMSNQSPSDGSSALEVRAIHCH